MKEGKRLLKIVLILTIVMGGLSVALLYISAARETNNNNYISIDLMTMKLVQLEEPKEGDPIAVIDTTLGEVKIVLYPEHSPNAVKNFTELAKNGHYNNTYIFDAQDGAFCGGGAANKNGEISGGTDERIVRELHQDLWPIKGAVCMENTSFEQTFKEKILGGGTYYNGSRFRIINTISLSDEDKQTIRETTARTDLADAFINKGGIPNFSQQMTIIGQTYEGLEVVEKLADLESELTGKYKTPKDDVMIKSITIGTYSESGTEK